MNRILIERYCFQNVFFFIQIQQACVDEKKKKKILRRDIDALTRATGLNHKVKVDVLTPR